MELHIFKVPKTSPKNRVGYFCGTDQLDPSQREEPNEILNSYTLTDTPLSQVTG